MDDHFNACELLTDEQRADFRRIDARLAHLQAEFRAGRDATDLLVESEPLDEELQDLYLETGVSLRRYRSARERGLYRSRFDATTKAILWVEPESRGEDRAIAPRSALDVAQGVARRNREDLELGDDF